MRIMVMTHPVNKNCFEVLFSDDKGQSFYTVDGFSKFYIERLMGYTVHTVKQFAANDPAPYRIMAKALAEKISYLRFYLKYKDEYATLSDFKSIAKALCRIQSKMDCDLDIPEVVQVLADTELTTPNKATTRI